MSESTQSPESTGLVTVFVTGDGMTAGIRAAADAPESAVEASVIRDALAANGVVHGIDEEAVDRAAREFGPNRHWEVAFGNAPRRGEPGRLIYKFDRDVTAEPKIGSDGYVDYKDIEFIKNAEEGQILVERVPPGEGEAGQTVLGKLLAAQPGPDRPLPRGGNTVASDDGLQLLAQTAGSIVCAGSSVSVQPVMAIDEVGPETGNIDCLGSLRVRKDISAGFVVKVGGDLEVGGNVFDAQVTCGGNVLVKGGCVGRGEGFVKVEGDIAVRYVENHRLMAKGHVTIGGHALSACLESGQSVRMLGQRGAIVGGETIARQLIHTHDLGSDAGTTTICRVGFDAELMREYQHTKTELGRIEGDLKRVKDSLVALYRLEMAGKLPPDKTPVMEKLKAFNSVAPTQLDALRERLPLMEQKMAENQQACILVEGDTFPGVQLYFGLLVSEICDTQRNQFYHVQYSRVMGEKYNRDKHTLPG